METKAPRPRILLINNHLYTLLTRNAVLEEAGFEVLSTIEPETAVVLASEHHFDLFIVGDSMTYDERRMLRDKLHELRPHTTIIFLCRTGDRMPLTNGDLCLEALEGPGAPLEAVRRSLSLPGADAQD